MSFPLQSSRTLILASLFGVAACAGQMAGPQIRAADGGVPAPLGSVDRGRFLLDQGQYGLAIDEFRKALRTDPDNVASVEGLARSYDQLGRADLSDRYYQQALALAPHNRQIYTAYAASLRRHGRDADALNLEDDLRLVEALAAPQETVPAAMVASVPESVNAKTPVAPAPTPAAAPTTAKADGPYLQRESLMEVRLVTSSPPPSPAKKPTRLVALGEEALPDARLRLPTRVVNAVGRRGIATRYVGVLARRGWSAMEAGDAVFKLERSQVMCPPERCAEAMRLAATLPFKVRAMPSSRVSRILVLLGKDALGADPQSRAKERA